MHVENVEVLVRVRETRECRIRAIVHESLEIVAIMIVLARLGDADAIECVVNFTVQKEKEILCHDR